MKKKFFLFSNLLIVLLMLIVAGCNVAQILSEAGIKLPSGTTIDQILATASLRSSGGTITGPLAVSTQAGAPIYITQGNISSVQISKAGTPTCTVTVNFTKGSSSAGTIASDACLVLDESGSMGWNDVSNNRITAAKNFFTEFLSGTTAVSGSKGSVNHFSGGSAAGTIDQALTNSLSTLITAVGSGNASGGTPLWEAVLAAVNHVKDSGTNNNKFVLALTDGEADDKLTYFDNVVSAAVANNIKVHTLALTGDTWDEDSLRAAATQTGGIYQELTSANISTFYTNFAQTTSTAGTLVITATSSCDFSTPGTYTVAVVLVFDGNTRTFTFTVTI